MLINVVIIIVIKTFTFLCLIQKKTSHMNEDLNITNEKKEKNNAYLIKMSFKVILSKLKFRINTYI